MGDSTIELDDHTVQLTRANVDCGVGGEATMKTSYEILISLGSNFMCALRRARCAMEILVGDFTPQFWANINRLSCKTSCFLGWPLLASGGCHIVSRTFRHTRLHGRFPYCFHAASNTIVQCDDGRRSGFFNVQLKKKWLSVKIEPLKIVNIGRCSLARRGYVIFVPVY